MERWGHKDVHWSHTPRTRCASSPPTPRHSLAPPLPPEPGARAQPPASHGRHPALPLRSAGARARGRDRHGHRHQRPARSPSRKRRRPISAEEGRGAGGGACSRPAPSKPRAQRDVGRWNGAPPTPCPCVLSLRDSSEGGGRLTAPGRRSERQTGPLIGARSEMGLPAWTVEDRVEVVAHAASIIERDGCDAPATRTPAAKQTGRRAVQLAGPARPVTSDY
jgi:hypothetical protein